MIKENKKIWVNVERPLRLSLSMFTVFNATERPLLGLAQQEILSSNITLDTNAGLVTGDVWCRDGHPLSSFLFTHILSSGSPQFLVGCHPDNFRFVTQGRPCNAPVPWIDKCVLLPLSHNDRHRHLFALNRSAVSRKRPGKASTNTMM